MRNGRRGGQETERSGGSVSHPPALTEGAGSGISDALPGLVGKMPGPLHTGSAGRTRRPALPARGRGLAALLAAALALAPAGVRAGPSFTFEKRQDVELLWSGKLRAGACQTGGNAESLGYSAEGIVSRTTRKQRLVLAGAGAYARSRVAAPVETDGIPGIGPGELNEVTQTTRKSWSGQARWDRFLSAHGSLYLLGGAASDEPAGKRLVLGAQLGYGIDVVHSEHHGVRLELGYDFSREDPVTPTGRLDIHSARLLVAYAGEVLEPVGLEASIEALTNLNAEHVGARRLRPLEDTRVLAKLGVRVKINGTLSTGLQLKAAYDHAPSARPPPPGASWAAGFAPLAERLDTTSELFLMAKF